MRYIEKMRPPDSFQHAVKNILSFEDWSEFKNPEKVSALLYFSLLLF